MIKMDDRANIRVIGTTAYPDAYNREAKKWGFLPLGYYTSYYGIIDPAIYDEIPNIVCAVVRNRRRFKYMHVPGTEKVRDAKMDFGRYVANGTPSEEYVREVIEKARQIGALDVDFIESRPGNDQSLYFRRALGQEGEPYNDNSDILFLGRLFVAKDADLYTVI